jgi:radical SAM superfamily enzyme YgiQ (UPF0313 family)
MKIKLIYAPSLENPHRFNRFVFPPLGVAQLKSFMDKKGYNVTIDDLNIKLLHENMRKGEEQIDLSPLNDHTKVYKYLRDYYYDEKIEKISDYFINLSNFNNCDVIGISRIEPYQEIPTLLIAKKIKQTKDIPIVVGGLMSKDPSMINDFNFVDYLIYHYGELPLLKLINYIEEEDGKKNEIPQLIFRENNKVCINKYASPSPHGPIHIKDLPAPNFEGLPVELYSKNPFGIITHSTNMYKVDRDPINNTPFQMLVLPHMFIKGCTRKCTFCRDSYEKIQLKPVELVSDEIKNLSKKFNCKSYFFMHQHINVSTSYVNQLCDKFIEDDLNIQWVDSAIPDFTLNKKLLDKMSEAGCRRLNFGVESGSQKILDLINKRTNVEEMEKVLKNSHESNIWNYSGFIVGMPYENDEDINKTINFIRKNSEFIDDYQYSIFSPRPPSSFYFHPEKFGIKLRNPSQIPSRTADEGLFPFDEIDGLSWELKKKNNKIRAQKISKAIKENIEQKVFVPISTLFHLYNELENKKEIRNWLNNNYLNLIKEVSRIV